MKTTVCPNKNGYYWLCENNPTKPKLVCVEDGFYTECGSDVKHRVEYISGTWEELNCEYNSYTDILTQVAAKLAELQVKWVSDGPSVPGYYWCKLFWDSAPQVVRITRTKAGSNIRVIYRDSDDELCSVSLKDSRFQFWSDKPLTLPI